MKRTLGLAFFLAVFWIINSGHFEGLLLGLGGLRGNVIRIGPSMLISEEEVGEGLERLERAFGKAG